ncbi:MAG: apolipoprotein N-acyltransferase [Gallionella sp.]|nr:apolipoprotein N-acyltransferase [Gallionella sp.]
MIPHPRLIAFIVGAVAVFGFAPFGLFPLPILSLTVLFWLWSKAERPAQAAWLGFSFGMGLFCVGIGWIYVALHDYGYMHPILAAVATALFAAVNAALPALAGYLQAGFRTAATFRVLLVMPAIWTLAEWIRGFLFTGFPWLSVGYSQVPNSPLVGYAPILGVFGVSLLLALSAALVLVIWNMRWSKQGKAAFAVMFVLWAGGTALRAIEWTQPQGEPLKISLLQGNIPQDTKFSEDALIDTLETYRRLAQSSDARLIVMPETALPLLRENVPAGYQSILRDHVRQNGGDILVGAFEREDDRYFNSVYSLGTSESQHYRKDHLVPFGEFIPLRSVFGWLINEVLQIPMGDQTNGGANQTPLNVAGQKIAVDICYEDAFGEEVIRALPEATLLVNVTNDAWYGDSFAAEQHNQLSQMRALETGRMMLRATNTGVTSVIGVDGHVQAALSQHEAGVLTTQVQGYVGSTPYVWWGNAAMLVLIGMMLVAAWRLQRGKSSHPLAGEG